MVSSAMVMVVPADNPPIDAVVIMVGGYDGEPIC